MSWDLLLQAIPADADPDFYDPEDAADEGYPVALVVAPDLVHAAITGNDHDHITDDDSPSRVRELAVLGGASPNGEFVVLTTGQVTALARSLASTTPHDLLTDNASAVTAALGGPPTSDLHDTLLNQLQDLVDFYRHAADRHAIVIKSPQ